MQVRWLDRLIDVEPNAIVGAGSDRLLIEGSDVDVNPLGCVDGKATVINARSYEEVSHRLTNLSRSTPSSPSRQLLQAEHIGRTLGTEWFYCTGRYVHETDVFVVHQDSASLEVPLSFKRPSSSCSGASGALQRPARVSSKRVKVR